jgi:hypothetical protein
MRRFDMKALFTVLNLNRTERIRIDTVLVFSTAVTFGSSRSTSSESRQRAGEMAKAVPIHASAPGDLRPARELSVSCRVAINPAIS